MSSTNTCIFFFFVSSTYVGPDSHRYLMSYPYRHFLISSLIIFPLHQFLLVSMSTTSCSSFGATYAPIKKRKNPNASTASSSSRLHPLTASKSPIHTTFYWRTSAPRFTASPSISGNIESCEVKSDALSYPGPVSMETTWFRDIMF
jgi:hypothetical protein